MKTKEEAKEFIKSTCDFVWVADTQILKNNDVLELMVEFANLASQPKWISVEEMPKDYSTSTWGEYLTLSESGKMQIFYFDAEYSRFTSPAHYSKITHWMPLPTPPEK